MTREGNGGHRIIRYFRHFRKVCRPAFQLQTSTLTDIPQTSSQRHAPLPRRAALAHSKLPHADRRCRRARGAPLTHAAPTNFDPCTYLCPTLKSYGQHFGVVCQPANHPGQPRASLTVLFRNRRQVISTSSCKKPPDTLKNSRYVSRFFLATTFCSTATQIWPSPR